MLALSLISANSVLSQHPRLLKRQGLVVLCCILCCWSRLRSTAHTGHEHTLTELKKHWQNRNVSSKTR
jgi:uncharacterized membrane protein YqjE